MTAMQLSRFWRQLEGLPYHGAVWEQWRAWLADELPHVRCFLRPHPELATAYPKLGRQACLAPYRIVSHGPDDHEGICDETDEIIALTREQLTVHELDWSALCRALGQALSLEGLWEPVPADDKARRLGLRSVAGVRQLPIFFSYANDPQQLQRLVDHLLVSVDGAFVLTTPTCRAHTAALTESVKRQGSVLLALADALRIDAQGRFSAVDGVEQAIVSAALAKSAVDPAGTWNIFRQDGDMWHIAFGGKTTNIRPIKGLSYIALTLAKPGYVFDNLDVYATVAGETGVLAAGDLGEVCDRDEIRDLKERRADIQAEIEEARRFNDCGRLEALMTEDERLKDEARRVLGLGGRSRRKTDRERVRKSMTNAITRALGLIRKKLPALAAHLVASMDRSTTLCYRPAVPVMWLT